MLERTRTLSAAVTVLVVFAVVSNSDGGVLAQPNYKVTPSRASAVNRKPSFKGQQLKKDEQHAKQTHDHSWKMPRELEQERIMGKYKEVEEDDSLTDEERELHLQEIRKEELQLKLQRDKKGSDPLYELRKRRDATRMDYDEEIELQDVHPPETVANLSEIHDSRTLDEYMIGHDFYHSILLVSSNCEQCADAVATFNEVAQEIAESEYHLPRKVRKHRFAVLDVDVSPERFVQLQRESDFSAREVQHFPVAVFINDREQMVSQRPHPVSYRPGKFATDLRAVYKLIQWRDFSVFRDEDELMHCAFELYHDGVAFALFVDINMEGSSHFYRALHAALHEYEYDVPLCSYSTIARNYHGDGAVIDEKTRTVTPTEETQEFLKQVNPNNAHVAALFVDEHDPDQVSAEYFTFDAAMVSPNQKPTRKLAVLELLRFRRWAEAALGRRHTSSGRRFFNVHRRQRYVTHGPHSCNHHLRADTGDTVTATVRATSVEHDLVFYEQLHPRQYVVGDPIEGLPPWLHDLFRDACVPSRHEIFSPPTEGFHGELVEYNVTDVVKKRHAPPADTVYDAANVPVEVVVESHEHIPVDDGEL